MIDVWSNESEVRNRRRGLRLFTSVKLWDVNFDRRRQKTFLVIIKVLQESDEDAIPVLIMSKLLIGPDHSSPANKFCHMHIDNRQSKSDNGSVYRLTPKRQHPIKVKT